MKAQAEFILENDDFVAINKPAGMLSIPDRIQSQPSLKDILVRQKGEIFTVHRLDKDTSGVIVFARTEEMHRHLSLQFENRQTEKSYFGFITGSVTQKKAVIDVPIIEHPVKKGHMTTAAKGKASVTEYEVLEEFGLYSFVSFRVQTGRTHQIRVHMKYAGHPIACDELYGDGKPILLSSFKKKFRLSKLDDEERPILDRLALHAEKLTFQDLFGKVHNLEAPLPRDMNALLQQLRKWKGQPSQH